MLGHKDAQDLGENKTDQGASFLAVGIFTEGVEKSKSNKKLNQLLTGIAWYKAKRAKKKEKKEQRKGSGSVTGRGGQFKVGQSHLASSRKRHLRQG